MEITGQVSVVNRRDRLEFESKPSMAMDYSSQRLNGIITVPDRQAKAYVALTNTSANPIEVLLTSDSEHVHSDKVKLLAHETKVEEIKLKNSNNSPLSALVTLQHNGSVGALITTAYAMNKQTGFTANLYFYDDAKTVSNKLAGVHFRFGEANPAEGFPAGTIFKAPLVLANLGNAASTATVTVDYTQNEQAKTQAIGSYTLQPRGLKEIELQSALASFGITGVVDNAGVDIKYTGTAGTIVGQMTSMSTNGDYSFDVPIKDPLISMNRTSGSYPFRLDGGYKTVLHLKNMTDKKARAVVQIRYEGGTYHPDQITMEPYQTVALDIKKLQSQQTLDIRGNIFPANITSGKIIWTERDTATVVGRSETANFGEGIAGSFSCPWCSCAPHSGFFEMSYISPFNGFSVVGDEGYSLRGLETLISCDEIEGWGPYWVSGFQLNWSSSNSGVVSVDAAGWLQCLAVGTSSIYGSYFTVTGRDNNSPNCDEYYSNLSDQAPVQVSPKVSISGGRDKLAIGLEGNTTTFTATGTPSGGTFQWTASNNNVILADTTASTVTVSAYLPSESVNDVIVTVTYSLNGQSGAATRQLTVQKPTSLLFVSDTSNGPNPTSTGWRREVIWQIMDQLNMPMQFANMFVADTISPNGSGTCSLSEPVTGIGYSDSNGRFPDTYFWCSSSCSNPNSNCQAPALQTWVVNAGSNHLAAGINVNYSCNQITLNGN